MNEVIKKLDYEIDSCALLVQDTLIYIEDKQSELVLLRESLDRYRDRAMQFALAKVQIEAYINEMNRSKVGDGQADTQDTTQSKESDNRNECTGEVGSQT